MAAIPGRDMRIFYVAPPGTGPGVVIAGARSDGLDWAMGYPDITDKDDDGVRRYLATLSSYAVSGTVEGVLKGVQLIDLIKDPAASALHTFVMQIPGIGSWRGTFVITAFSHQGENGDDPATFSMTIESSGVVTWTAAT
jgi:predicted secreted protein